MKKGDTFKHTFIITNDIYKGFMRLFKDKNPLHVNKKFARERGFSGRVIQGNILTGFLSYFIGECLPVKNIMLYAEEIKFHNPVYLNDVLNLNVKITGVFKSVDLIEMDFDFKKPGNKLVAQGKISIGRLK